MEELGRRVADDIVEGVLLPGARLEELALADRFGVSRTPIREALRYLEATGLVEKRPNRGAVVTRIGHERLLMLFEAMAELEAIAARLAAGKMTPAEKSALARLHESSFNLVYADDRAGYEVINRSFHKSIHRGAHNDELMALIVAMHRRVAPFRHAQFAVLGRLSSSASEHGRVLSDILSGNPDAAARAMREHLVTVGDATASYLLARNTLTLTLDYPRQSPDHRSGSRSGSRGT
ncbi:MAG: GntR family transcriptional regulator [Methylocella sp.]